MLLMYAASPRTLLYRDFMRVRAERAALLHTVGNCSRCNLFPGTLRIIGVRKAASGLCCVQFPAVLSHKLEFCHTHGTNLALCMLFQDDHLLKTVVAMWMERGIPRPLEAKVWSTSMYHLPGQSHPNQPLTSRYTTHQLKPCPALHLEPCNQSPSK